MLAITSFITLLAATAVSASPLKIRQNHQPCYPQLGDSVVNILVSGLSGNQSLAWDYSAGSGGATVTIVPLDDFAYPTQLQWQLAKTDAGFNLFPIQGGGWCVVGKLDDVSGEMILVNGECNTTGTWNIGCSTCGTLSDDPYATGCTLDWLDGGYSGCATEPAKSGYSMMTEPCAGVGSGQSFDFELA